MAIIKRDQAPHAYNLEPVWHDSNSAYSKTPGGADSTQKLQTQIGVFGYQLHPFQWVPPVSLHCLLLPQSGGLPAPFKAAYAGGGGVGGGGLRCPRVAPRRPCTGTAPPLDSPAAALHRWPYGLDNPSNGLVSASIRPLDGHVALHFPFALWPPQMALPPLAPFSPPLLGSLPSADRRAPSRRRSRGGPRGGMWWRHGGEGGLQCGSRLSGRGGPWRRPAASRAEDKFGASGISQA
jgi:hypothetical protein